MRNEIAKKLKEFQDKSLGIANLESNRVFYGQRPSGIAPDDWNYIVFGMEDIEKSGTNSMDFSRHFFVDIIREDFIDDNTIFSIIDIMESIAGMKLCRGENPIDYVQKGNTDIICEIMRLKFVRPVKRVNING